MAFSCSGVAPHYSQNLMFFQMHLVHGAVELIGAFDGFISSGLIILQLLHIVVKELISVLVAVALFGHQWKNHLIRLKWHLLPASNP